MVRFCKLALNFILSGFVFVFLVLVLIFFINPNQNPDLYDLLLTYADLAVVYVPAWVVFITLAFNVVVFFTERKYPIGFFSPPTPTYFIAFTVLVFSIIAYFNYQYYYDFFSPQAKARFIRLILMLFALVIAAMVFTISRKRIRRWGQFVFTMLFLWFVTVSIAQMIAPLPDLPANTADETPWEAILDPPRKVRLVIMEGLSLNFVLAMSSEQRLHNFNLLMENGARGRFSTFRPNLDAAMTNTLLSGREPAQFSRHSNLKFQFKSLPTEFDKFPRFIFFRNLETLHVVFFYKDETRRVDDYDYLRKLYVKAGRKALTWLQPRPLPFYSRHFLSRNSIFIQYFSPALQTDDLKFTLLKKAFFFDENRRRFIPDLKSWKLFYSASILDGMNKVKSGFFQYHQPQPFSNVEDADVERYGWVIDRYYDYYDTILGNLIATTGDDEILVVLSQHEPEPLPTWRRMIIEHIEKRDVYVYKSLNSMGTVFFYEKKALRGGTFLDFVSIYDIFPTLAYYAGFPLSRDLKGQVLKEIFTDDFLIENPVHFKTK